MQDFSAWVGRSETMDDTVSPGQLVGLAALLDHEAPPAGAAAPLLAHWLHFLPRVPQSRLDTDGHPKRGGLLPPIPLPRRMWAGGRLDFHAPLLPGAAIQRTSTIASVRHKAGASGELVFVTIRHDVSSDGQLAIVEEQDIVYREAAGATAPAPAAPAPQPHPDIVRPMQADTVQLFRYSALTFNAHRIHYDRDYARDVEGYAGLVVHGPYLATLLLAEFQRAAPGKRIASFRFRAMAPLLDSERFELCLAWTEGGARLWTRTAAGQVTMVADVGVA